MAEVAPNSALTAEELAAAIAEVEALGLHPDGAPAVESSGTDHVVPVPLPAPAPRKAASPGPAAAGTGAAASTARAAETAPVAPRDEAAASGGADRASLVYRVLDAILELINRPFAWLGPRARNLVAVAATVTLIMSLLAALLLPRLVVPADPVSFLQRKRAERLAAPPPNAPPAARSEPRTTGGH